MPVFHSFYQLIFKMFLSGALFIIFLLTIPVAICSQKVTFGISYPPFNNEREMSFTVAQMKTFGISHLRISESWKYREPAKKTFSWAGLDSRIESISKNNLDLLLSIDSQGPEWAVQESKGNYFCIYKNPEDFRNYIDTLTKRYSNKIKLIQFSNEWDIPSYQIDEKAFVMYNNILYEVVKKNSPHTEVVLGGITCYMMHYTNMIKKGKQLKLPPKAHFSPGYTDSLIINTVKDQLTKGGAVAEKRFKYIFDNAKYDAVDVHLYDDVENWNQSVTTLKQLVKKPIIVSEFGCVHGIFEVYTRDYQSERLSECLKTLSKLPIREAYHFSLVDNPNAVHKNNGLFDTQIKSKPAYEIFKNFLIKHNQKKY